MSGTGQTTIEELLDRWVLLFPAAAARLGDLLPDPPGTHLVGFLYVDLHAGISLHVLGTGTVGADGTVIVTSRVGDRDRLILRHVVFQNLEPQALTASQRGALGLPEIPDWLEGYRRPETAPIRRLAWLDPLRCPGYPDDIRFRLARRGMQAEVVWGTAWRLAGEDAEGFTLIECELLNEPNQDWGVHAGDRVLVRAKPDTDGGVLVGFAGPVPARS
ncbi:MAG: hypothetical protein GX442_05105 [Candidatus Riflebacteria bacterium]|nr:hypothetical protein [Candidatus Riflebacteria bacterium]